MTYLFNSITQTTDFWMILNSCHAHNSPTEREKKTAVAVIKSYFISSQKLQVILPLALKNQLLVLYLPGVSLELGK